MLWNSDVSPVIMIDLHFHPAFIVNDSIVELPTKCLFYRVEGRQTPYDGVPSMINRSLNHISHDWSLNMRWTPALWNFFVQFNKKYDQKSFPDLTAIRIAGTCNPNPAVHSSSAPQSELNELISWRNLNYVYDAMIKIPLSSVASKGGHQQNVHSLSFLFK